jgi:DNA-binding CsgD family transcriptional regulator
MAPHRPPEFRGRASERGALDRLLEDVREGRSAVLVIRGEPGVGKSALLRYCIRQASGFRVARCVAIESEMELPFAGLHQLCAPMLSRLDALPEPQRNALSIAFGLSSGTPSDRFLVALAALSLLAEVAEEQGLLCVVDDAQWLDRASAQVLGFVARRLLAESVAIVVAVREPSEEPELTGLPELVLEGLGDADARALLETVVPGRLDELVRDRIVAETRGNPLALLELPRGLTAAELAGGFALPDAGSLPLRIEDNYVRLLQELPEATQRLLLLAAADPAGDATLVRRAAQTLGIGAEALAPAKDERLLEIGARVQFRHPLVRSAVYRASTTADRRAAHAALAGATDPELDPDRRAWHRAHAACGVDEEVAGELMHSRGRAQRRGGIAAAAAFLERAVALTRDPSGRAARALAAAQAKFAAGDPDAAQALLTVADVGPLDELAQAQVQRLRAEMAFELRRGNDAPPLLLRAAQRLERLDAELARETYLEAMLAAFYAGRFAIGADVLDVARAAHSAQLGGDPLPAKQLLLAGLATRVTDGYVAAAPTLKQALHSYRDETQELDWACLAYAAAAMDLWDDTAWLEIVSARARLARASGTLSFMPLALDYLAGHYILAGELSVAAGLAAEAESLESLSHGERTLPYIPLQLAAWRGEAAAALDLVDVLTRGAAARGEGAATTVAEYATAVLYNGLGEYALAAEAARNAAEADEIATSSWALCELVEAEAGSGRRQAASAALDSLVARTRASGTDWAQGIEARSRALLADGEEAEDLYLRAIAHLGRCRMATHRARAELVYGEWLRRENRRADAREQLRRAHDAFASMGIGGFAERARHELVATGERVRRRRKETHDELTPQEEQIARLARDGLTNPEIGAQLFISPRTVEWHMRKVFTKLEIGSRRDLDAALRRRGPEAALSPAAAARSAG